MINKNTLLSNLQKFSSSGISKVVRKKWWHLAIALTMQLAATPVMAASKVTLKLGGFESAIAISELEQFAKTGTLTPQLQLYSAF